MENEIMLSLARQARLGKVLSHHCANRTAGTGSLADRISLWRRMFGGDPLAEIVTWDPDDDESIRKAIRGVGVAIYMVGVPYTDFHFHPVLMRRFIDAAVAEKVDRL